MSYFFQILTRNAGPGYDGDYFARNRRLSKPTVDALVAQLELPCPPEFSAAYGPFTPCSGVWTIDAMTTFVTQNDTVLIMKKRMRKELEKDVYQCRKEYKRCKRQAHFSTGGFRPFLLLEQALAQKKEEEDNWRIGSGIGSYHSMFICKDA